MQCLVKYCKKKFFQLGAVSSSVKVDIDEISLVPRLALSMVHCTYSKRDLTLVRLSWWRKVWSRISQYSMARIS